MITNGLLFTVLNGDNSIKGDGYHGCPPNDNGYMYTNMYPTDTSLKYSNAQKTTGYGMVDYLGETDRLQNTNMNYQKLDSLYPRHGEDDDQNNSDDLRQDTDSYYYMPGSNGSGNVMDYNLGLPFLHPSDPSSYAIISPSLFQNNEWPRFEGQDQFADIHEVHPELNIHNDDCAHSYTMPPPVEVKQEVEEVMVSVELQEALFNRLQWYYVTCRFVNSKVSFLHFYVFYLSP